MTHTDLAAGVNVKCEATVEAERVLPGVRIPRRRPNERALREA
jgi:hypothetical protein